MEMRVVLRVGRSLSKTATAATTTAAPCSIDCEFDIERGVPTHMCTRVPRSRSCASDRNSKSVIDLGDGGGGGRGDVGAPFAETNTHYIGLLGTQTHAHKHALP